MLMLPVTIGLGLINFDLLINSILGSLVSDEAPRAIDAAFRIYMLPQGMFSVAVATVLFPTLQPARRARATCDGLRAPDGERHAADRPAADPGRGGDDRARRADHAARLRARRVRRRLDRAGRPRRCSGSRSRCRSPGVNLLLTRTFFCLQRPWLPTALAARDPGRQRRRLARALRAVRDRGHRDRHRRRRALVDDRSARPATCAASCAASRAGRTLRRRAQMIAGRRGAARRRRLRRLVRRSTTLLGRALLAQVVSVGAACWRAPRSTRAIVLALRMPEARQILDAARAPAGCGGWRRR